MEKYKNVVSVKYKEAPCGYGETACKKRSPTCHATCKDYKEYSEGRAEIRKAKELNRIGFLKTHAQEKHILTSIRNSLGHGK